MRQKKAGETRSESALATAVPPSSSRPFELQPTKGIRMTNTDSMAAAQAVSKGREAKQARWRRRHAKLENIRSLDMPTGQELGKRGKTWCRTVCGPRDTCEHANRKAV